MLIVVLLKSYGSPEFRRSRFVRLLLAISARLNPLAARMSCCRIEFATVLPTTTASLPSSHTKYWYVLSAFGLWLSCTSSPVGFPFAFTAVLMWMNVQFRIARFVPYALNPSGLLSNHG